MKLATNSAILGLFLAFASHHCFVNGAGEDADHDDHDGEMELCSEFEVVDEVTCETWCGPTMTSEWVYLTEHGDFEENHVDFLTAWECHCEPSTTAVARQATVEEEKHCLIPYEFPTCEAVGLADCGANATMTCGELCDSVGLGAGGSTTDMLARRQQRFLGHVTDEHFCAHHEHGDERRILQDGDEDHHDEEEAVTLCFCNADSETSSGATVACSDADLEEHDNQDAGFAVSSSIFLVAALGVALAAL